MTGFSLSRVAGCGPSSIPRSGRVTFERAAEPAKNGAESVAFSAYFRATPAPAAVSAGGTHPARA